MSTVEGGSHEIIRAVERLGLNALEESVGHVYAAAALLRAIDPNGTSHAQLRIVQGALEEAIRSGEAALRATVAGRMNLGLYLLNIVQADLTATPDTSPPATEANSLVRSTYQPGSDLDIRAERVVALPMLMDEGRNVLWVRVNGRAVPLLESLDDRAYQGYADNWQRFRDAGMPVPPLYLRGLSGTLLIPDIKEGGSEVYGTGMARDMYRQLRRDRPRPGVDQHFIRLTGPDALPAVVAEVRAYVDRATRHNLQLPDHDPFQLVVHSDGTWKLAIRDLRTAIDLNRYPYYRTAAEAKLHNEQSAARWLTRLRVLRAFLTGEPSGLNANQLRLLFDVRVG